MDDLDAGMTVRGLRKGQRVFNRFLLKTIIGHGGMGVVWQAHDEKLDRDIALKFLPFQVAQDPEAIRDLKRETKRALELTHPRIVRIFDFVEDEGCAAISMEFVDGKSLALTKLELPNGHFEVEALEPLVEQLCEALAYAHDQAKIIHRDLKPANLLLNSKGDLKITDFGISATLSDTTTRFSKASGTSGTPIYMSPQQMMGEKPCVSDDIYSVGATLYELLTSKPPFYSGRVESQLIHKVPPSMKERREELKLAGEPIPQKWESLVARCLAKKADERPKTASEIHHILQAGADQVDSLNIGKIQNVAVATEPDREQPISDAPTVSGRFILPKLNLRLLIATVCATGVMLTIAYLINDYLKQQHRIQEEQARIANARGGVQVTTQPAFADVSVSGITKKSPATFDGLKPGNYDIMVHRAGFQTAHQVITIIADEQQNIDPIVLTPQLGAIEINSDPAGLEFELTSTSLDDENHSSIRQIGNTPTKLEKLPTGTYKLEIRRDLWPASIQAVIVRPDGLAKAGYSFVGWNLKVNTTQAGMTGAIEIVDGSTTRSKPPKVEEFTIPHEFRDLQPVPYSLTFKKEGHHPQTLLVQPSDNSSATKEVNVELKRITSLDILKSIGATKDEEDIRWLRLSSLYINGSVEEARKFANSMPLPTYNIGEHLFFVSRVQTIFRDATGVAKTIADAAKYSPSNVADAERWNNLLNQAIYGKPEDAHVTNGAKQDSPYPKIFAAIEGWRLGKAGRWQESEQRYLQTLEYIDSNATASDLMILYKLARSSGTSSAASKIRDALIDKANLYILDPNVGVYGTSSWKTKIALCDFLEWDPRLKVEPLLKTVETVCANQRQGDNDSSPSLARVKLLAALGRMQSAESYAMIDNAYPRKEAREWLLWFYSRSGDIRFTKRAVTLLLETVNAGWNWSSGSKEERDRTFKEDCRAGAIKALVSTGNQELLLEYLETGLGKPDEILMHIVSSSCGAKLLSVALECSHHIDQSNGINEYEAQKIGKYLGRQRAFTVSDNLAGKLASIAKFALLKGFVSGLLETEQEDLAIPPFLNSPSKWQSSPSWNRPDFGADTGGNFYGAIDSNSLPNAWAL